METIVRNVRDLSDSERSFAERLVGHTLGQNQQLAISVLNPTPLSAQDVAALDEGLLPEWCNVYEGLSEEQIDSLEKAFSRRLDLTRPAT